MATTITKLFPTGILQSRVEFDEYSLSYGQEEFTTPGTYSWTAPAGVTSVSVVAVGGGGGGSIGGFSGTGYATSGGGGGLGWKNNITVVQGQTYTVVVGVAGDRGVNPSNQPGSDGGDSYFISAGTVLGGKGFANGTGGTYIGDGGGNGGLGRGGGGGAGGYSGNGGNGETYWNFPTSSNDATDGNGGGGGGGTCSAGMDPSSNGQAGGGGGGVGLYGQGTNGSKGQPAGQVHSSSPGGDVQSWRGGGGGSGGTSAIGTSNSGSTKSGNAGQYGGGGGGWGTGYSSNTLGGKGGGGAVRIIWGSGRAFPSTNTNNMGSATSATGSPTFRVSPTGVYAREFDEVTLTPTILAGITTGGTGSYNVGEGIVVDSLGNTYVVGWTGPSNVVSSICLIKYDSTGTVLWQTKLAGSEVKTKGYKVAVDSSNNVYIVGSDSSSASPFGWVVTAKFNSDGAIQWQRKLETVNTQGKNAVALDSSGNVYVAATARFNNRQTCLLIKYDSNGTIQWQRRFYESTSGYSIFIHGIAVDSSGNVYACGSLGNFPTSIVVVKYNTSGVYQWHSTLGNASPDDARAYGMSVDSSNNIYITGTIYNSGAGVWSMFLAKINSSGALQWQRTLTPSGTPAVQPTGYGVTVDSSGNVYTVGFYNDIWDVILTKHDVSGTLQWQRNLSSSGYEVGHNISLDLNGNICITGFVSASSDADIFLFSKLPTDGSRTGNYNIGQYSFTYSASSLTTATSTISYNIGSPGYTLLSTDPGITESAGILTVSAGTLVSTNNGGGVVIPAERRTSTGTYMVSGYFDEITIAPTILGGLISGGTGQQERGQGIAIDSQGNTYITAYGGSGGANTIMYLIKYDSASNILWQKSLSGVAPMTKGLKVTTDSSNNVYVVGLDELSASPYTKWLVVVKFDSSGSIQWQRRLETNNNTVNSSIALDSSNNVYIGSSNYSSKSSYLIVKYDSSGVIQWQRTLSNSGSVDMFCNGIAVDSSGNVYACGTFGNSPTLSVIVKFNTSGVYQWHYTLGDDFPSSVWLYGMSIDSSNNIFMTGVYYNPASGQSILLTKINSSGALQWQRTLAQANNSQGYATAVDTAGNVYVTGKTNNVWDIIIAKYNTSGTLQWQRTLSSSGYDSGYNMSISSSGDIHLVGSTTVGGTEDIYFSKLPSDGSLTGSVIVGGYGFTYSPSSLTTATSTISYNLNTPGYTVSASSSGLPESAGVLTVATSTLTSTNNS